MISIEVRGAGASCGTFDISRVVFVVVERHRLGVALCGSKAS